MVYTNKIAMDIEYYVAKFEGENLGNWPSIHQSSPATVFHYIAFMHASYSYLHMIYYS